MTGCPVAGRPSRDSSHTSPTAPSLQAWDVPVFAVVLVGAPHPARPVAQGQVQGLAQEGLEHQARLPLDLQQGDGGDGRGGRRAPAVFRHHGCSEQDGR